MLLHASCQPRPHRHLQHLGAWPLDRVSVFAVAALDVSSIFVLRETERVGPHQSRIGREIQEPRPRSILPERLMTLPLGAWGSSLSAFETSVEEAAPSKL